VPFIVSVVIPVPVAPVGSVAVIIFVAMPSAAVSVAVVTAVTMLSSLFFLRDAISLCPLRC
jgi:hypothetical protein